MSFYSWVGMVVGLTLAVTFPVGTLYLFDLDNTQADLLFMSLTVAGSLVGVFLAGLSMSARTRDRY